MKTLSVIMPRFANTPEVAEITQHCAEKVIEHAHQGKLKTTLTIVDDGSEIPPKHDPRWITIEHGQNRGIACAWNTGWEERPESDFYCWLNADCEVTPGWSFPLVAAAEQLGVIAMPYTNGEKSEGIGITGWCFLTTKDILTTVGPFDETFVPCRYEDTDWFHRAIYYHQIPLVNVPSSNVLHERMKGGTKDVERFEYLHMANRYRYAWKHGVDVEKPPPFWTQPLPEVEITDAHSAV